jgi:hypothetical protein
MKRTNGLLTIYEKHKCRYYFKNNDVILLSDDLKIDGFTKIADNIYGKRIPKTEIKNAFSFLWKCKIGIHTLFILEFIEENSLIAYTDNPEIFKALEMKIYDKFEYHKQFHFSELDAIWEERSESPDGLPFPEGLARIEYLKGGPGDL